MNGTKNWGFLPIFLEFGDRRKSGNEGDDSEDESDVDNRRPQGFQVAHPESLR